MHKHRRSRNMIDYGHTPDGLARMCEDICNHSHTLCAAWAWRSLVLLNDSTSEDSVLELAVFHLLDKRPGMRQCESLTVWDSTSPDRLAGMLESLDRHPSTEDFGVWDYRSPHRTAVWKSGDEYITVRGKELAHSPKPAAPDDGTCPYCA